MANILTGIRILCGLLILCFPAFSEWYYCFYLLGGFSDAIDGIVARKTGKVAYSIPAHKIGKLWKFKKSELDEWVKSGKSTLD